MPIIAGFALGRGEQKTVKSVPKTVIGFLKVYQKPLIYVGMLRQI